MYAVCRKNYTEVDYQMLVLTYCGLLVLSSAFKDLIVFKYFI